MAEVTVIIISWNAKDYLQECLQSLESDPSVPDLEIIVVDNASSDGSPEMVATRFPEVILVRNTANVGFARANNIGMKLGTGQYLCLVNSDVQVLSGCLRRLYAFMEQQTVVGMAGPKVYNADGTIQYSCRRFPSLWRSFSFALGLYRMFPGYRLFANEQMSDFRYDRIRAVNSLSGCFLMARRKAVEEVGLLDEQFFIYSEDVDWCKRFWDRGWRVVFYPEAEIIHYGGGSSQNAPAKFAVEQDRAKFQYWKKHYGYFSLMLLKSSIFLRYGLKMLYAGSRYLSGSVPREDLQAEFNDHLRSIKQIVSF